MLTRNYYFFKKLITLGCSSTSPLYGSTIGEGYLTGKDVDGTVRNFTYPSIGGDVTCNGPFGCISHLSTLGGYTFPRLMETDDTISYDDYASGSTVGSANFSYVSNSAARQQIFDDEGHQFINKFEFQFTNTSDSAKTIYGIDFVYRSKISSSSAGACFLVGRQKFTSPVTVEAGQNVKVVFHIAVDSMITP